MNAIGCRELGKEYSQKALEFLLAKAGGSAIELSDLMEYQASAVSWLTASGFCLALEKAGPDEAYRFLSLVMAGTSACVRLKDAPFMLTMSAKLDPVEEEAEQPPPQEPAGGAPAASCSCQLVDGECQACPPALKLAYLELSTFILSYLRATARQTEDLDRLCKPCGARYVDRMISELVKDGISKTLGPESEVLKQQAVALALQTITVFGISDAPLTVQALRERQGA